MITCHLHNKSCRNSLKDCIRAAILRSGLEGVEIQGCSRGRASPVREDEWVF